MYNRNKRSIVATNLLRFCCIMFPDLAKPIIFRIFEGDNRILKLTKEFNMSSRRTDLEIINEIEDIRANNNNNWMDLMRLAFEHAPEESRNILTRIETADGEVTKLLEELSNERH